MCLAPYCIAYKEGGGESQRGIQEMDVGNILFFFPKIRARNCSKTWFLNFLGISFAFVGNWGNRTEVSFSFAHSFLNLFSPRVANWIICDQRFPPSRKPREKNPPAIYISFKKKKNLLSARYFWGNRSIGDRKNVSPSLSTAIKILPSKKIFGSGSTKASRGRKKEKNLPPNFFLREDSIPRDDNGGFPPKLYSKRENLFVTHSPSFPLTTLHTAVHGKSGKSPPSYTRGGKNHPFPLPRENYAFLPFSFPVSNFTIMGTVMLYLTSLPYLLFSCFRAYQALL